MSLFKIPQRPKKEQAKRNGARSQPSTPPAPTANAQQPPEPQTALGKRLGTDDETLQCHIVDNLIQGTAVVVITYNFATQQVDIANVGPRLTMAGLQEVMNRAQTEVLNRAINQAAHVGAKRALEQTQTPPAPPQETPPPADPALGEQSPPQAQEGRVTPGAEGP